MGFVHWNWNSILANRLYCQVDTRSKKTIFELPKHEKDARTSKPIFAHIEDKPKVA